MEQEEYYELPPTPSFCKQYNQETKFTLVADNFGTKYQSFDNVNQTIKSLEKLKIGSGLDWWIILWYRIGMEL